MDSLTQIALGGAIGAIIGGKKYGKKSALIGAIGGTTPDMDILLFPFADPVTSFTFHRGFSHSFLFIFFATPLLAWIFSKIKWFGVLSKEKEIYLIMFFALLTHVLLDGLTIYGTQLLWPWPSAPIGLGSVFIIDPLYTLPLITGLTIFFISQNRRGVAVALIVSSLYLSWGLGAQYYTKTIFNQSYTENDKKVLVQTTPFNTFLWRILVMNNGYYEVGYYSVFDKNKQIKFKRYSTQTYLIPSLADIPAAKRLEWFTKDFYSVRLENNNAVMTDLRMGLEPDNYIFSFIIGEKRAGSIVSIEPKQESNTRNMGQLSKIWQRIWNEDVLL